MTENEKRLDVLFEELVPASGKASSKAGEIVRAVGRISYRNYNDGDHVGVDYGKETCNPAARYLLENTPNEIGGIVMAMWGVRNDDAYDVLIDLLIGKVVEYVNDHQELREEPTRDMFEYRIPSEDVWDDDEDDEYWEESYDDDFDDIEEGEDRNEE